MESTSEQQKLLTHLKGELDVLQEKFAVNLNLFQRCKGQASLLKKQKEHAKRIEFLNGVLVWREYDKVKDKFRERLGEYNNLPSPDEV